MQYFVESSHFLWNPSGSRVQPGYTYLLFMDPRIQPIKSKAAREHAVGLLRSGQLVAIPTETVYGLAALATDDAAASRIYAAKGRPSNNPLICHVTDLDMVRRYVQVPAAMEILAEQFWPGPLTLIVREGQGIAQTVRAGTGKVGFRMPDHALLRELLGMVGVPLAAPSANRSGKPSGTRALHVAEDFSPRDLPLILDGGPAFLGLESTIVDLTPLEEGNPALLVREGAIRLEDMSTLLPLRAVGRQEEGMTVSPGLLYRHYAPDAPLTLLRGTLEEQRACLESSPDVVGTVYILAQELHGLRPADHVLDGGPWGEPWRAAQEFFHLLREADRRGARSIVASTWSLHGPMGVALRERQERAAS